MAVIVLQRRPREQVVGGCDQDFGHVEVHPVFPVHLRRHTSFSNEATENRAGLGFQAHVFASRGARERRPVLDPGDQIARGGHRETRDVTIPCGIREHILTVVSLDDSRILDAAR